MDWPADRIERRDISALLPYAANARLHSEDQIDQIAASIREFGWTIPVLVDDTDGIIAGHGRVLAAKRLGIETVPVMVARGWGPDQRRAYVLADNRLAENAEWDSAVLLSEITALSDAGVDLWAVGYSTDEVSAILGQSPELRERDEQIRPKQWVRALISIPVDQAMLAQPVMDSLSTVPGVQVDYAGN